MKAMLFAAGKGRRLRPLTNSMPKCLVKAGDRTLLEHAIAHLKNAGVTTVVINIHHLGDQIEDFVRSRDNFHMEIIFSREEQLLETGGGLLKAAEHFQGEDEFLVCNSDIYTELDLGLILKAHRSKQPLATLAVADRKTSRYLRFNRKHDLCGWENQSTGETVAWNDEPFTQLAFNGIQVVTPEIFDFMSGHGTVFSTIPVYLKAAEAGRKISAFRMDNFFWMDVGTQEKLETLNRHLKQ